jgi:uncharacterized membrane protein (DUF2068 family)
MPKPENRRALHAIALFEALKGLAALLALAGVLDLMHHDVRHLAMELIGRFGLDPHARYPSLLLHYADLLPAANLQTVVLLGAGYITLRWAEAYGLWNDLAWGEWLGALSGALYLPFEISHLLQQSSWGGWGVLAGNLALVVYLVMVLLRRRARLNPRPAPDANR